MLWPPMSTRSALARMLALCCCASACASAKAGPSAPTSSPPTASAESAPRFPGVEFAAVRAFAFDLDVAERPICAGPLARGGTPCRTVVQPGVVMSAAQIDTLLALLHEPSTWGSGSACFLPHHGFVFYDVAGLPVAEISVCLMCDMLAATPAIPQANPVEGRYGLGDAGTTALRSLCNELGLPKCDAKQPTEFAPSPSTLESSRAQR